MKYIIRKIIALLLIIFLISLLGCKSSNKPRIQDADLPQANEIYEKHKQLCYSDQAYMRCVFDNGLTTNEKVKLHTDCVKQELSKQGIDLSPCASNPDLPLCQDPENIKTVQKIQDDCIDKRNKAVAVYEYRLCYENRQE